MKILKTITTAFFLAFVAFGCEREDLHYPPPTPSTTDSIYEEPYTPKDAGEAIAVASRLNGSWQGSLTSRYIDDYGKTVSGEYTTEMSFSQYEVKAVNGSGSESDYKDGKRVWKMAFTWFVESYAEGGTSLRIKRADGYELVSKVCRFDGDTLKMELVGTDGLETNNYVLTSSK